LALFNDDGSFVSNKDTFTGKKIEQAIHTERSKYEEVYIFVKRSLIDAEQMTGSMEAVMRTKIANSKVYHEKQIAWIVEAYPSANDREKILISKLQVWTDPVWDVTLNSLKTPLPAEIWSHSPTAKPMTREQISNAILQKIIAYSSENVHMWSQTVHSEVIMHPPWDMLMGRDTSKEGVHVYFQHYKNTQITPLKLMYDEKQPNFAVYQQIFKTTNKSTGEKGEDLDFVFVEIVDEKIRYWRTYFDTTSSAQKGDSTFRQQFCRNNNNTSPSSSPTISPSSSPSTSPTISPSCNDASPPAPPPLPPKKTQAF